MTISPRLRQVQGQEIGRGDAVRGACQAKSNFAGDASVGAMARADCDACCERAALVGQQGHLARGQEECAYAIILRVSGGCSRARGFGRGLHIAQQA